MPTRGLGDVKIARDPKAEWNRVVLTQEASRSGYSYWTVTCYDSTGAFRFQRTVVSWEVQGQINQCADLGGTCVVKQKSNGPSL